MAFEENTQPLTTAAGAPVVDNQNSMAIDYVAAVRNAYAVAERKDLEGWIALFTAEGEEPIP